VVDPTQNLLPRSLEPFSRLGCGVRACEATRRLLVRKPCGRAPARRAGRGARPSPAGSASRASAARARSYCRRLPAAHGGGLVSMACTVGTRVGATVGGGGGLVFSARGQPTAPTGSADALWLQASALWEDRRVVRCRESGVGCRGAGRGALVLQRAMPGVGGAPGGTGACEGRLCTLLGARCACGAGGSRAG